MNDSNEEGSAPLLRKFSSLMANKLVPSYSQVQMWKRQSDWSAASVMETVPYSAPQLLSHAREVFYRLIFCPPCVRVVKDEVGCYEKIFL